MTRLEGRVWIAADGADWQEIGYLVSDGLVSAAVTGEPVRLDLPHTVKLSTRTAWTWYGYHLLAGRRHPASRRVKREYHRRRR